MKNYIPIENEVSYVKDEISGAIINIDSSLLAERLSRVKSKEKIQKMQDEIDKLKYELKSIKNFLNLD
jgi:hypothetical protein